MGSAAPPVSRPCPACLAEVPASARFCFSCGTDAGATCTSCGTAAPAQARFCGACGSALATILRAGPPFTRVELLKPVTVMFVDMVGSTALSERMHPEDVRALMNEFFTILSNAVATEGGTVERFIGDAVMADFGVPVAHEDDPARAVRAALRALADLETWNARGSHEDISVRIGINTGEVSVAGEPGEQFLVTGDPVNVAARLESNADPNTILIGERTARAVRHLFELSQPRELILKGKSEPVRAYTVVREGTFDRMGHPVSRLQPMVGREREMEILSHAFEGVRRTGRPRVVALVGEAGMGKSRLTREFVNTLGQTVKVVAGRCIPDVAGSPLWPFAEIARYETGVSVTDDPDVATKKIRVWLDELGLREGALSLADIALASTLGIAQEDPVHARDPRRMQQMMLDGWCEILQALAARATVVIVIEDLHWAEALTTTLLRSLVARGDAPILVVCPTRSQEVIGDIAMNVHLGALTPGESEELFATTLESRELPPEVGSFVLERCQGNPFFIQELVRHLVEEGYLQRSDRGWRAATDLDTLRLPDTVQGLILARVDALEPADRSVLQTAAVAGRRFPLELLETVTGDPNLGDAIQRLVAGGFLIPRRSTRRYLAEYQFRHVLIKDVCYQTLPRKRRARVHEDVAEWLHVNAGDTDGMTALLAHHYEQAYTYSRDDRLRELAREYLSRAAQVALSRFALTEAESLATKALDISSGDEERSSSLEALGDLYMIAMRGEDAWSTYVDALEHAQRTGATDERRASLAAKAAIAPTRWVGTFADLPAARDVDKVITDGLAAAEGRGEAKILLLASRAFFHGVGFGDMPDEAERAAEEAVDLATQLGDPDLLSLALDASGVVLWPTGRFADLSDLDERRLALVPHLTDVREVCDIYLSAGRDSLHVGDYARAVEHLTACLERARGTDSGQQLHGLVWRVPARFMAGDWDGAIEDVQDVRRAAGVDESGLPPAFATRAFATAWLCHELRGENEHAAPLRTMFVKYLDGVEQGDHPLTFAGPLAHAARALAVAGDADTALSWLHLERWVMRSAHLEMACAILANDANVDLGRHVLQMADEEAITSGSRSLAAFADRLRGHLHASRDDVPTALDLLHSSADAFARLGAEWESAVSRLMAAELLSSIGRSDQARSLTRRAIPVFERLRSSEELRRAEALL